MLILGNFERALSDELVWQSHFCVLFGIQNDQCGNDGSLLYHEKWDRL